VKKDGRLVGEKVWKEKVYYGEESKKLLRKARNRRILRMPMELINRTNVHCSTETLTAKLNEPQIINT
jgi:hypothetical protein